MKLIAFLLLISGSLCAQIKGIVKDGLSGKPIHYVNIWVENESIGTTSEIDGRFSLNVKEEKVLVFSALGYESIKLSSTISEILLKPKTYELDEIIISNAKRNKKTSINKYNKNKINVYRSSSNQPTIVAKKIEYSDQIEIHPFIKEIKFLSSCQLEKAKIILRFLDVDSEGKPGADYLEDSLIIEVKKGKKNNKVDLTKYNIRIPKDGIFIAFEWLIIEENKFTYEYTKDEDLKKVLYKDGVSYQPSIGTDPSDVQSSWSYHKGSWFASDKMGHQNYKKFGFDNKYSEFAIELVLTN